MIKSAEPNDVIRNARVVACVVTYNRAALLKRLLFALREQSFDLAEVIVVDNASIDETGEVVAAEIESGFDRIRYVPLTENRGGAGGFSTAIDLAMTEVLSPTHLWLMDDDGYPDPNCLERLLRTASITGYSALNPVVWADTDRTEGSVQELAFPGPPEENEAVLRAVESGGGAALPGLVRFFNGSLLDTRMVKRAGMPIAEFFIWGDELEYLYRIQRLGYTVAMVTDANYFHPKNRQKWKRYRLGPVTWNIPQVAPERRYYMARNFAYIAHRYGGMRRWLLHTAKWLVSGGVNPLTVLIWCTEGLSLSRKGPIPARWQR